MQRGLFTTLSFTIFLTLTLSQALSGGRDMLPRALKRAPRNQAVSSGSLHGGGREKPAQTLHVVSRDILDMRSIMGAGRRLIRHDCDALDALEAVFTKDIGVPAPSLHCALSNDEGETWSVTGPLGGDSVLPDRDLSLGFAGGLTRFAFVEGESLYFDRDLSHCGQAFSRLGAISDSTHLYSSPQVVFAPPSTIYLGVFAPLTGNAYFTRTTDDGITWGPMVRLNDVGTEGFNMERLDAPVVMDAEGDLVALLTMVVLEPGWAGAHGFLPDVSYPAYSRSSDGGQTWSSLRLLWGNDGAQYPRGHSGDPGFDAQVHYIGGVEEAGYSEVQDNVAITADGVVHLAYTMNDTTFGYRGVFHTLVDDGSLSCAYIGFPEDPGLSGESGMAYMPALAESELGVVVGWTEFVQPQGNGDICYNWIWAGDVEGTWPMNVTQTSGDDETYQRICDTIYTYDLGDYFIDWIFFYSGDGGSARDSTLWHLQAWHHFTGVEDGGTDAPLPRATSLAQNYPNPFNPVTTITYTLEHPGRVSIEIRDVRGRLMRKLEQGVKASGTHTLVWNGSGDRGEPLPSGVYLYRLRTEGIVSPARKMLLLR